MAINATSIPPPREGAIIAALSRLHIPHVYVQMDSFIPFHMLATGSPSPKPPQTSARLSYHSISIIDIECL